MAEGYCFIVLLLAVANVCFAAPQMTNEQEIEVAMDCMRTSNVNETDLKVMQSSCVPVSQATPELLDFIWCYSFKSGGVTESGKWNMAVIDSGLSENSKKDMHECLKKNDCHNNQSKCSERELKVSTYEFACCVKECGMEITDP